MKMSLLRALVLCSAIGLALKSHGQNLVPNPSFENFTSCPTNFNIGNPLECQPWQVPTAGTSDYFNACHVGGIVGVPNNIFGSMPANTGNAYAGGLFYYGTIPNYREYLGVQLTSPLVAGTAYEVSFYCSVGDLTCPINKVGIYFSNTPVMSGTTMNLNFDPQVEWTGGLIQPDVWTLVTDCYVALGGEQYITIGNFYNDAEVTLGTGCAPYMGTTVSYMFIDDVSVEEGPPPGEIPFTLGPDITVCDSYEIVAPVQNANYIWQDGSHDPTFSVTETGLYALTVTSGCNVGQDTIEVTVLYSPDPVDLGMPQQILCPGVVVEYNLDPTLGTYTWQDNTVSPDYIISTPGAYSVTLSTPCGDETGMVNFVGLEPPSPFSLGADTTLCPFVELELAFDPALGDFMWQNGSMSPSFTITEPGDYALTISNYCGEQEDEISVMYYPEPFVVFNFDTIHLCDGESYTLMLDPDVGEYFWQDGEEGSEYTVTEPGIYSVTVVNPCGSDNSSIVFDYDFEPVINLGPDITICPEQLPYVIDLTGWADVEHFVWDDGTTDPTFAITEEGGYGVTVSNDCFEVWDFINVTVQNAPPVVTLPADTVICAGESLFLDVSNIPGTYSWQDFQSTGVYEVTQSGSYSVTVSNSCGEGADTITVIFGDPLPTLDLGPDLNICPGETAVISTAIGNVSYQWNDGSTGNSIMVTDADTVVLVISNGCASLSDTVIVSVNGSAPQANLPDELFLCTGDTLSITSSVAGASYAWSNSMTSQSISVTTPGEYILTVTNACGMDIDTTVVSDAGAPPVFDLGPDQSLCPGDAVLFDPAVVGDYEWQDGSTATTFSANSEMTVVLTVTNTCGSYTDSVIISLLVDAPVVDLGPDTSICPGSSVTLNPGVPNVNYAWSDGSMNSSLTVITGGQYYLDISNACGSSSDTISVTLLPDIPLLNLGPDLSICPGDTVTLDPGLSGVSYLWQDGSTDNAIDVFAAGQVILMISNSCGVDADTVNVSVNTTGPVLDLGPDLEACNGETILISPGVSGVSYLWQDGSTGNTFLASATSTVILQISNSCGSARDTIEVIIDGDAPDIDLGADQLLCDGEMITLQVTDTNVSVVWQDGSTGASQTVSNAGVYSVEVTNVCGSTTDTIEFTTLDSPAAFVLGPDQEICAGESVILTGPVISASDQLLWNTGNDSEEITVTASGQYILVVSNACGIAADTVAIDVNAELLSPISEDVFKFCEGESVVLNIGQTVSADYVWDDGAATPTYAVMQPGTYGYTITSECDQLADEIIVEPGDCSNPNVFIPNVFSPNHDGVNDAFSISLDDRDVVGFEILIYDRWGGVVFNSKDIGFEWGGDVHGELLPPGVYVYQLRIERQQGARMFEERFKGDVTLIR